MENTEKTLITRVEAADRFMVTVRTIDRLAKAGHIHKYENLAGHVRVCLEELQEVLGSWEAVDNEQ